MTTINYKGGISMDTAVFGDNVYFDPGPGCATIWFSDVPEAREFLKQNGRLSGQDAGVCDQCRCRYSISDKNYKNYKNFACRQWKRDIKKISSAGNLYIA